MARAEAIIFLLYLINILQPVAQSDLGKRFGELYAKTSRSEGSNPPSLEKLVDELLRYDLIIRTKGRYSVTREGLARLTSAGLGKVRDKNRLFALKNLL